MSILVEIGMGKWKRNLNLQNRLTNTVFIFMGGQPALGSSGNLGVELKKKVGERTFAIRIRQYRTAIYVPSEALEYWLSLSGYNEAVVTKREKLSESDYIFLVDY